MLVEVDAEILCDNSPDSNIKFSSVEQKGMFNVLLNDP